MSDTSASPAKVLVWDLPVRLFHWLTVACFAGAYLSAESERWRLLHTTLGYTMAGLLGFRLVWGLVGTRHARFSSFVRGPAAVWRYLRTLVQGQPEHHLGHNPAGAWAILALLGLGIGLTASGWALYNELGGDSLEEVHEVFANLMVLMVGVHVAGVWLSSWRHKENLVLAMFTGRKQGLPAQGIPRAWYSVAAIMLVLVLGFWWQQWQQAPTGSGTPTQAEGPHDGKPNDHDDDDD